MVRIQFSGAMPSENLMLGPAPYFRITGNFMRVGPDNTVAARYKNHFWEIQGQYFTSYRCVVPIAVHFEDAQGERSSQFGPFASLGVADGVAYADGVLFARLVEESQLWHSYAEGTYWPVMVITPPKQPVQKSS
jgi:hypothetical protein